MNSIKTTEQINPKSTNIHKKKISDILRIFNSEDLVVIKSIQKILPELEKLIGAVISCFQNSGRLFYIGSGTSGRLGVLDSAECPPTFSTDPSMVQAIIAGGKEAVFKSIEGAEDSFDNGEKIILDKEIQQNDFVVGISASGTTPYVLGGLKKAKEIGAQTALIQSNDNNPHKFIDYYINVIVGPEIISGSTRMKAGTATKIILNMITTVSMIKINKTYGNIMTDLKTTNNKLTDRGINIISNLLNINKSISKEYLLKSEGNIKAAIIMYKYKTSLNKAHNILAKNNNSLSGII